MTEITRRRLLGSAGGALAASLLPINLQKAIAYGPRAGSLRDIRHVVVHMQENRSFDHYFGTLAGVRGFGDPHALTQANGQSIFYQPDPSNPDGYLLPWHLDTKTTSSQAIPSTSHAWTVQHQAWNNGLMNNWLPAHLAADGAAHGPYTMSYYERDDIPFHFALAESFTLCDGYHCSLLGPTWPNRMYLFTGWNDPNGQFGGPIISNVVPTPPYSWTTYPERLTDAGVSWQVYQEEDDYGCNPLEFFGQYQDATVGSTLYEGGLRITQPGQFEHDARNDNLPTVSWIIPTSGQSEHPAYIPASGADFLASKLDAVAANPDVWAKTLYIINYDENDGLFDHVPPPTPPAGTPDEFVDGLPIGGGIRVPCFLVSPWTVGGFVASESFDHTSVLQLLELITGVAEPNVSAWRRQTFGDFTSALGFSPARRFPALPATKPDFFTAEQEVETLPAATFPGADQTPPVQEKRRPGQPWFGAATSMAAVTARRAARVAAPLPATPSRLVESTTTHRSDFEHGMSDTVFPGLLAAVADRAVAASVTSKAYVPGIVGGNVAVIDASAFTLVSAITGVTNPYGAAAIPGGGNVYVTNSGTNTVAVIDPSTNAITGTITVGLYPHGITASPDGQRLYAANTGPDTGPLPAPGPGDSNTVSAIDVSGGTVVYNVPVGNAPRIVAVSPDGSTAYVTCHEGVYVIDTSSGQVSRALTDLSDPNGITVSPDGSTVYVTIPGQSVLAVVSASSGTVEGRIAVGSLPWNVALSPDGSTAYVTNASSDTVSVIDTKTAAVTDTITVGHVPTGLSITGDGGALWVANNTSSTLTVIDPSTNAITSTVDLGISDEPTTIAFV